MFTILGNYVRGVIRGLMLESYGWRRRKGMYQGRLTIQWQDPHSLHWYAEKTALRLMRVQALDQFYNGREKV
jgi:hypothetical protein